jgi:hypothetical protein
MSRTFRGERALAVIGAAAILVLGYDAATYAATGSSLLLGRANTASATTTVKNTGKGPALSMVTRSSGYAPFVTNAKGLVNNLYASRAANSDKVGGKTVRQVVSAANDAANAKIAYAHVLLNGTVDAANSSNFTQKNITHKSAGVYCVKGLSFTPHVALANLGAPATVPPATSIFTQVNPDPSAYGNPAGWGCPAGTQIAISIYTATAPIDVDREFVVEIR